MAEIDQRRLERAGELQAAGRFKEAIEEYRGLADSVVDPIWKAGVLLNEVTCLKDSGEISLARGRLDEIKATVPDVGKQPDSEDEKQELCVAVEIKFEEIELYLAERKEKEALAKIDELLARYPRQIRRPEHRYVYEAVQTRRGFLLANFRRCAEAKPILEEACSFEHHKSSIYYYLGHCYCALSQIELARQRLIEALNLGLPKDLEYRAHDTLGIVYYKLGAYARAKQEFELCAQDADDAYIKGTWRWLARTCRKLGLNSEAGRYAKLAKTG